MGQTATYLRRQFKDNWPFLLLIVAGVLYVLLRTSPTEGIDSLEALDTSLQAGQPVVVEFYSNL